MREERGLLVDDRDPPVARGERPVVGERRTIDRQRARVGLDGARENLDQRGFAGAVLPDDRVHLAGAEVEGHLPKRLHSCIGLRQPLGLQQMVRRNIRR